MANSNYTLQIDWQGAGTFGGTGVDVSTRVLHVEFQRVRDVNSALTGEYVAGTLQAVLNDQSGDYNSYNTASPLTGSLKPGRLVRLQQDGTTIFQGYTYRIIPQPSLKSVDKAVVEAIGPLGFINQALINVEMLKDLDTGAITSAILSQAKWPTDAPFRELDAGKTTIRRYWADRRKPIDLLREVEKSEAGFLRESKAGAIVFENRHRRLTSPYFTSTATFSDAPAGTQVFMAIAQDDPLPFIFNETVAEVIEWTAGATATLWKMTQVKPDFPIIPQSHTLILWANFPGPTAASNEKGVEAWIIPTATVDYQIYTTQDGIGINLNGSVTLTASTFGNQMRLKWTNTGNSGDGFINFLQARGVPVLEKQELAIAAEDSASQAKYGHRTISKIAPYIPTPSEAADWARWHLSIYGEPIVRLEMTYVANRSTALLAQARTRELSERITIIATGTHNNLGLNRDFYIEGQKHVIEADRTHTVTYMLSEAVQAGDGMIMDVSELGERTRLAY